MKRQIGADVYYIPNFALFSAVRRELQEYQAANHATPVPEWFIRNPSARSTSGVFFNLAGIDVDVYIARDEPDNPNNEVLLSNYNKLVGFNVPAGTSLIYSFAPETYTVSVRKKRFDTNGRIYYPTSLGDDMSTLVSKHIFIEDSVDTIDKEFLVSTAQNFSDTNAIIVNRTQSILVVELTKTDANLQACINTNKLRGRSGANLMPDMGGSVIETFEVLPGATVVIQPPQNVLRLFVTDPNFVVDNSNGASYIRPYSQMSNFEQLATSLFTAGSITTIGGSGAGNRDLDTLMVPTKDALLVVDTLAKQSPNRGSVTKRRV